MNKKLYYITTVIITLILLPLLLSWINFSDIVKTLANINPTGLAVGFGLYILTYFLRAVRFHILLNREVGIKDLFNIVCIHNMANSLLPARTGELSYVYLLKKRHNKTVGVGAATLIITRLFDMIAILMLLFLSTLFVSTIFVTMVEVRWIAVALMVGIVLVLLTILYSGHAFVISLRKIVNHLGMDNVRFTDYIFRKLDETNESFSDIHRGTFIWSAFISILIWITIYSLNYTLIIAMGLDMGFWAVLFASTFAIITTVSPIQGIGGFGTMEGGWVIGFIALGISKKVAISMGFSYHILIFIFFIALGLYGIIILKYQNRTISQLQ